MKKYVLVIIIAILVLIVANNLIFAQKRGVDKGVGPGMLKRTTNIHYTGKYCHTKIPSRGGNKYIKYNGDFRQLCRCHYDVSGSYLHPVDIEPGREKRAKIPADMPLRNGKITCATCHNIYLQCQKRLFVNEKVSLRSVPYMRKSEFCYKCHDKKKYRKLNPHDQITEDGRMAVKKCLYCHTEKPDETQDRYKDVRLIGDIEMMCQRCHLIRNNHSGNFNHMIKPSAETLARMDAMEKKFNIVLPLSEDGKLTCVTCHNSHERGVIPVERPGAKGADSVFRHRLPGILCQECHEM